MFVAVLCGDKGRGRNAFINRHITGLESSGKEPVFCGPNTKPACWESSLQAKLSARHHNCISPGFTARVGNSRKICALEETWDMQQTLHPSTVQTEFEPVPWE